MGIAVSHSVTIISRKAYVIYYNGHVFKFAMVVQLLYHVESIARCISLTHNKEININIRS